MTIRVLFFGATADDVGAREIEVPIASDATPSDVLRQLSSEHPRLGSHRLLFAVNEEHVDDSTTLKDGDDLAIFTAVSGG